MRVLSDNVLAETLHRAAAGEAVWMPDLRENFSHCADACPVKLRLHLVTGGWVVREIPFPRWNGSAQKCFVSEYFYACVYNVLSVFGGQEMIIEAGADGDQARELFGKLESVFQCRETERHGYGKVISISNRLCAAEGLPPFSFRWEASDGTEPTEALSGEGEPGGTWFGGACSEGGAGRLQCKGGFCADGPALGQAVQRSGLSHETGCV